jgi:hypothetical protein
LTGENNLLISALESLGAMIHLFSFVIDHSKWVSYKSAGNDIFKIEA